MRRKVGVLALMIIALFLFAGTAMAINITIYDGEGSGSGWWGEQEDEEVEPGNQTGQKWDLEGFFLNGTQLTMVGGYNFFTGESGNGQTFYSGDIFIDVDGDAIYGSAAFGLDGLTTNGVQQIANNYGYDYVIDLDVASKNYDVLAIDSSATLNSVYYRSNDGANPWSYLSGGTLGEDNKLAAWQDRDFISYNDTGSSLQYGFLGGTHYALTVDLGFLAPDEFSESLYHFTIECGNDNMIGKAPVPEPATMLMLGTGLIGLAGFGRKKFKKKK